MDYSLQGSSVHGISQGRILEWVAIPFSRVLPDPGIQPESSTLQADSLLPKPPGKYLEAMYCIPKSHMLVSPPIEEDQLKNYLSKFHTSDKYLLSTHYKPSSSIGINDSANRRHRSLFPRRLHSSKRKMRLDNFFKDQKYQIVKNAMSTIKNIYEEVTIKVRQKWTKTEVPMPRLSGSTF